MQQEVLGFFVNVHDMQWGTDPLILILTLRFNDCVIQLYKKVKNFFISLVQHSDNVMFI